MHQELTILCLTLALPLAGSPAAEDFQLREKTETMPEVGQIKYTVITSDNWELTFLRPSGWSLSLDATTKKATFRSRDYGSTIVLQIRPENPAVGTPGRADELRRQATARFPGAKIDDVFTCYTGGLQGPAFDLHEEVAQNLAGHYRLAFVPFGGGTIEFTLITSSASLRRARQEFGSFLTSFNISPAPNTASTAK